MLTVVPLLLGWLWADSFAEAAGRRPAAGRGRGELRGGAAAGQPLVSAAVPGPGDGHRRRRQQRHGAGHALRPAAGGGVRLARVFGLALIPVMLTLGVVRFLREGQPEPAAAEAAASTTARAAAARHLVVLPVLLGDVRRLRRPGELPEHASSTTSTAWVPVEAGNFAHAVRHRRLVPAAGRRLPRRPLRRHPLLVVLYVGRGACDAGHGALPPVAVRVLLFVGMGLLGMGNGAVFQLVPQRSRRRSASSPASSVRRAASAASSCRPCWAASSSSPAASPAASSASPWSASAAWLHCST